MAMQVADWRGFYHDDVFVAQDEAEIGRLLEIMKERNVKSVLELGYYFGGTSKMFDDNMSDGIIVSVDINPQGPRMHWKNKEYLITGDTTDPQTVYKINDVCKQETINGFDMLFVDANHEGEYPYHDFMQYKLYVRDGGFVAVHDIQNPNVKEKYARMIKDYPNHEEIVLTNRSPEWFGIGIIYL